MNSLEKIKKANLEYIEEQQDLQDLLVQLRLEQKSMIEDSLEWKLSNLLETGIIQQGTVRGLQKQIELVFIQLDEINERLKI